MKVALPLKKKKKERKEDEKKAKTISDFLIKYLYFFSIFQRVFNGILCDIFIARVLNYKISNIPFNVTMEYYFTAVSICSTSLPPSSARCDTKSDVLNWFEFRPVAALRLKRLVFPTVLPIAEVEERERERDRQTDRDRDRQTETET